MSYFKVKMHQKSIYPAGGAYSTLSNLLAKFKGPYF